MYVPEIHEQRKKISGLKMPRRFSPRLPGASTKGQVPLNPYVGNKMKVASLSGFRDLQIERELLKTASLSEEMLYYEMKKVAEYGSEEEILFMLQQYSDMEKEGGIIAKGFDILGKALGGIGKATGSARVTSAAAKASDAAAKRYSSAAINPRGMRQVAKADQYGAAASAASARGGQQAQAAKTIRESKQLRRDIRAGTAAEPAAVAAPTRNIAPSNNLNRAGRHTTNTAVPTTNFANMSDDALQAAAKAPGAQGDAARAALAKRVGAKAQAAQTSQQAAQTSQVAAKPPPPNQPYNTGGGSDKAIADAVAEGTKQQARDSLGRNILLGGGTLAALGGTGIAASTMNSMGREQNMQQSQRGFNYGM